SWELLLERLFQGAPVRGGAAAGAAAAAATTAPPAAPPLVTTLAPHLATPAPVPAPAVHAARAPLAALVDEMQTTIAAWHDPLS
ncbi:MAG TPA: hypothetical protein VMW75_28295, partial [Thermoanaerobaculia bacterium]|nr:hypothetical protein [Thermoanaerobaculia bacterium]